MAPRGFDHPAEARAVENDVFGVGVLTQHQIGSDGHARAALRQVQIVASMHRWRLLYFKVTKKLPLGNSQRPRNDPCAWEQKGRSGPVRVGLELPLSADCGWPLHLRPSGSRHGDDVRLGGWRSEFGLELPVGSVATARAICDYVPEFNRAPGEEY